MTIHLIDLSPPTPGFARRRRQSLSQTAHLTLSYTIHVFAVVFRQFLGSGSPELEMRAYVQLLRSFSMNKLLDHQWAQNRFVPWNSFGQGFHNWMM
ncbi:hypothetical protein BDM02DRAFT_2235308 [Thelephora ganbajun]|uniref:Uncharacterized protein n=1 Tax=Thelephora ganbajun TaxID=370292 RepID=A0ACB6ZGV4_THEGA|nr:hypothetical protein BDM02DRAFT_2235308 [Thelephora ganbajun]